VNPSAVKHVLSMNYSSDNSNNCEIKLHFDVMIMMTDSNVLNVLRLVGSNFVSGGKIFGMPKKLPKDLAKVHFRVEFVCPFCPS
jgi:hypothetical protein